GRCILPIDLRPQTGQTARGGKSTFPQLPHLVPIRLYRLWISRQNRGMAISIPSLEEVDDRGGAGPTQRMREPVTRPDDLALAGPPRNCRTISTACATPVAPTGWPRALSPPDVFTETLLFNAVNPSAVAGPPLPFSMNRKSSIARISEIVKLSWTSATWTSFGWRRASWNALLPAITVASKVVRSRRSCNARKSLAWPEPAIRIGVSLNFRAFCI